MGNVNQKWRGLIFDVGDILYDATPWRRWLTNELSTNGIDISYSELVQCWEILLVHVYKGQQEYWSRFRELLSQFGLSDLKIVEIERLAKEKGMELSVNRIPMEGVTETLAKLHDRGVRLGALSDTESDCVAVRKNLAKLGIEQYFHAVVTSKDTGFVKPESDAYLAAIVSLGLEKNECAFVGHDYDELLGAKNIQLNSIAFNYEPNAVADVYIAQFSELLNYC